MKFFSTLRTRLVVWVWTHTPTCAEMSRLASQTLEQPPGFIPRWRMRLHFVICVWCRRYSAQINFMHHHAPKLGLAAGELPGRALPAAARERIRTQVRKHLTRPV